MPPKVKSYIMTATWYGLGISRVPDIATARSQIRIRSSGKPAPSTMARSVSSRCRLRRGEAAAAGRFVSEPLGRVVAWSLTWSSLHELLADGVRHVGRLPDLLLLDHQAAIGLGA